MLLYYMGGQWVILEEAFLPDILFISVTITQEADFPVMIGAFENNMYNIEVEEVLNTL